MNYSDYIKIEPPERRSNGETIIIYRRKENIYELR